jgi:L-alanine-DL-glutamate epimerase-like enolase superfamily enzyme
MRITDIRETSIALNSTLKNSSIDFSEMTTSVVAVITDVLRDGKPVVGCAFNSTGRYACGAQMRARFIPRILKAEPKTLLNAAGDNFDPEKILGLMMRNEKSGGHSERSVGIGTIEVAIWDAVAKIEEKPLHVVLAERRGPRSQMLRLCRRWLVCAGKGSRNLRRDEAPSRCRLHHGEDESRRRAAREDMRASRR